MGICSAMLLGLNSLPPRFTRQLTHFAVKHTHLQQEQLIHGPAISWIGMLWEGSGSTPTSMSQIALANGELLQFTTQRVLDGGQIGVLKRHPLVRSSL